MTGEFDKWLMIPVPMERFLITIREVIKEEIQESLKSGSHSKTQPNYLSAKQTAELLKVSMPTLRSWTKKGLIKAYRISRRVLYKADEIHTYLRQINSGI